MPDAQYPRNMQEFIDQGWENNIFYRISVFKLKDSLNNPEDLKQEILLSLLKTGYLDRYDESKGSFKGYLYAFVDNFLRKKYNKEHTRHGKYIVTAASLSTLPPEEGSDFDGTEMFVDMMPASDEDCDGAVAMSILIQDIRRELAENFKASSSYEYNGVIYDRDPLTVFNLMLNGATVMDVANVLHVSRQFVYHLLKSIRTSEAYRIYAEAMH